MKKICLVLSTILCNLELITAQNIIHVQNGVEVVVQNDAILSLDGLTLQPSGDFFITNNALQRMPAPVKPLGGQIKRVYNFTNPTSQFRGAIRFQYAGSELNNMAEGRLMLNTNDGARWSAHIQDVVRNMELDYIQTRLYNPVSLKELTLAAAAEAQRPEKEVVSEDGIVLSLNLFPVPVQNAATLSFQSTANGAAVLIVTDAAGRTVLTQPLSLATGVNRFTLQTSGWMTGVYYLQVALAGGVREGISFIKK